MTKKQIRETVERHYYQLERLAEKCARGWGPPLLTKAYEAAKAGEKAHRGFGKRLGQSMSGRQPVDVAAMYFALRCTCDPTAKEPPKDWYEASNIRDDYRLGYAQAHLLREAGHGDKLDAIWAVIELIDYARDLAGRAA